MMRTVRARRVVLAGAAAYALARAWLYLPRPGAHVDEPMLAGTGGGVLLPIYVALWTLAAVLNIAHFRSGRLGFGFHLTVGLMWAWAGIWTLGGILTAWPLAWQTALTQIGLACIVSGLASMTRTYTRAAGAAADTGGA